MLIAIISVLILIIGLILTKIVDNGFSYLLTFIGTVASIMCIAVITVNHVQNSRCVRYYHAYKDGTITTLVSPTPYVINRVIMGSKLEYDNIWWGKMVYSKELKELEPLK